VNFLNDIALKPKLILLFVSVAMLPLLVTAWQASNQAQDALMASAYNQLKSVRQIKSVQIDKYFSERKGDMGVLMETVSTLRHEAFSKLGAIRTIKRTQITNYLMSIKDEISLLAGNQELIDGLEKFEEGWDDLGNSVGRKLQHMYITNNPNKAGSKHLLDASKEINIYNQAHAKYHPWLRDVMEAGGYYDVFLVNHEGKWSIPFTRRLISALTLKLANGGTQTLARSTAW
jgi:methyl-accepting chemotaxis protein